MLPQFGLAKIKSKAATAFATFLAMTALAFGSAAADEPVHIVAYGDSLTAGYGLPAGADFASRLESRLKTLGRNVRISNAGVSGDTTTGGLARFDWAVPPDTDAVILELGANDGLRGVSPEIAKNNLDQILTRLAAREIPVLIAGMQAPANWGDDYKRTFDGMFARLADKHGALLYPFFLEGVIDQPQLKLPDALHPNAKGVDTIVERILPSVEKLIAKSSTKTRSDKVEAQKAGAD